jgi:hypothetical protein
VPQTAGSVNVSFGQQTINGISYSNALLMQISSSSTRIEVNAGRRHTHFRGELGIPDNARSETTFKVDISLDNSAPVLSVDVHFGETTPLDLDVTNILRLKFSVSNPNNEYNVPLAIGNPRFAS